MCDFDRVVGPVEHVGPVRRVKRQKTRTPANDQQHNSEPAVVFRRHASRTDRQLFFQRLGHYRQGS